MLDADFGWTRARGVGSSPPPPPPPPVTVTTRAPNNYNLNWTTRLRGRAGFAANDWLFYVAGGAALADLTFTEGETTTTTSGGKYWGWTVGGGIEHALSRHVVGRVCNISMTISATRITPAPPAIPIASR